MDKSIPYSGSFEDRSNAKGLFHVAFKILLRDGDKLLIVHDIFKDWDTPGGRMKPHEFGGDIRDVINRKMSEELGSDVQFELRSTQPCTTFQVRRTDVGTDEETMIFALGYEADYHGGQIQLGEHHDKFEWVDITSYDPSQHFTGGWLIGLQHYLQNENLKSR